MKRYFKWIFVLTSLSLVTIPVALVATSCSEAAPVAYKINSSKGFDVDKNNKIIQIKDLPNDVLDSKSKYDKILIDFSNLSQYDGYHINLPNNIGKAKGISKLEIKGLPNGALQLSNSSLDFISQWTNLTSLELTGLNIKSFSFVENLSNLTYLDLTSNLLTNVSKVLDYKLVNLVHLDLTDNNISSIGLSLDFSKLSSLAYLSLINNKITGLPPSIINWSLGKLSLYVDKNKLPSSDWDGINSNTNIVVNK